MGGFLVTVPLCVWLWALPVAFTCYRTGKQAPETRRPLPAKARCTRAGPHPLTCRLGSAEALGAAATEAEARQGRPASPRGLTAASRLWDPSGLRRALPEVPVSRCGQLLSGASLMVTSWEGRRSGGGRHVGKSREPRRRRLAQGWLPPAPRSLWARAGINFHPGDLAPEALASVCSASSFREHPVAL